MADDTYVEALDEGRDWIALARDGKLPRVWHRERDVEKVFDLVSRGRSVLLVGPTGVGKSGVLAGVATKLAALDDDAPHARLGLVEFTTAGMFAGTRYLGEWQTKARQIAAGAIVAKAALLISDPWNLPRAGRTSQNEWNLLDALRPQIAAGTLTLVGEASPERAKLMNQTRGLMNLFEMVAIEPLSDDDVRSVLTHAAEARGLSLSAPSLQSLIRVTTRFAPVAHQPGPALKLLAQALDYRDQKRSIGEDEPFSPAFIEKVFCINSGLPEFVVSPSTTIPVSEVRTWFTDRIVGQSRAIDAIVEVITLLKAALHDPSKPIGTLLFVGPTGVGKTEVARALATFLFGSSERMLRFDLSEFKSYDSFKLLIGDPSEPDKPARLVDPVRMQPFQVVLFDELEKAHSNIYDLLLPLLDEGRLTTPSGETIDFRNTILVVTSNLGAADAGRAMGFGAGQHDYEARVRSGLEAELRPELLNRFQHIVVFHPLTTEQLRVIARHEIGRVLAREGITSQGLVIDVTDEAVDLLIAQGIDKSYGARALKREVQRRIVLPVALTLMEQKVAAGSLLRVVAKDDTIRVRVIDTPASLESKHEQAPVRDATGRVVDRADGLRRLADLSRRIDEVATAVDATKLAEQKNAYMERRRAPGFWKDADAVEQVHDELEWIELTLDRLDRLRKRIDGFREVVERPSGRADWERVAHQMDDLSLVITDAHRELCVMSQEDRRDALVEIRPVAGGRDARDRLSTIYEQWAVHRRFGVDRLLEPREDTEPVLLGIRGFHAYGFLRRETGLHRFRLGKADAGRTVVADLRVAPWARRRSGIFVVNERALKGTGQLGGRTRSRLEAIAFRGDTIAPLVLQNERGLAGNRELAPEILESWRAAPPFVDHIVRRYDEAPPLVRDVATDFTSGRPDALAPAPFSELLELRVDRCG